MNGAPLVARLTSGRLSGAVPFVVDEWTDAVDAAFATIVLPPVLPPARIGAAAAFRAAFGAQVTANFYAALQSGLVAYAAVFAAGTVPPGISTPPAGPFVLALPVGALADSARMIADAVVAWSQTGTYVATPGVTPPVPWV